jgi:hypothetical protein
MADETLADRLEDIITHAGDFKHAIQLAIDAAAGRNDGNYDVLYWQHQMQTYERIELVIPAILAAIRAAVASDAEAGR